MKKSFIIALNSISAGGKTTLVKALERALPRAKALYFDDRDYDVQSGIEDIVAWDREGGDVNQFNLQLFKKDILGLINQNTDYILLDYPL